MTTCLAREGLPSPAKVMPTDSPYDGRRGDGLPSERALRWIAGRYVVPNRQPDGCAGWGISAFPWDTLDRADLQGMAGLS